MYRLIPLIALVAFSLLTLTASSQQPSGNGPPEPANSAGSQRADSDSDSENAQDNSAENDADRNGENGESGEDVSLQRQYLQKQAELAKHEYISAALLNEEIPLVNSKLTLLRLQQQAEYAATLLQQADNGETGLRVASMKLIENDAEMASQRLKWALEANEELVGAVPVRELRALELRAELAELALKRAQEKDYFDDPLQHVQWQLNRLRSDLWQLEISMTKIESGW